MNIRQFISALTIAAIAGAASAGVVKVDLAVGEIKPGATIVISLDELVAGNIYKLGCTLTSNHASGKIYNVIQVTTPTNYQRIGINAEEVVPGSHQYNLPTTKNSYLYGDIFKAIGAISITNLDDSDTVTLSSCHAVGRVFGPRNGS